MYKAVQQFSSFGECSSTASSSDPLISSRMPTMYKILKLLNVEPLLFLCGIGFQLYGSVFQAFFTYKECSNRLWATGRYAPARIREACLSLGSERTNSARSSQGNASAIPRDLDDGGFLNEVQASTALYLIEYNTASTLPVVFSALLLGAWCDDHGRKPIILTASAGTCLALALAVATASIDWLPLRIMTLVALIKSSSGAGVIIHLAAFAMISDVATTKTVFTIRIGIASGMISIGAFLGSLLSGAVLARWDNFSYIFMLALAFVTLAFLYAMFILVETYHWAIRRRASLIEDPEASRALDDEPIDAYYDYQPCRDYDYNPRNLFCGAFVSIRESINVLIRKRQGGRRSYLLLSLLSYMVITTCEPSGERLSESKQSSVLRWSKGDGQQESPEGCFKLSKNRSAGTQETAFTSDVVTSLVGQPWVRNSADMHVWHIRVIHT